MDQQIKRVRDGFLEETRTGAISEEPRQPPEPKPGRQEKFSRTPQENRRGGQPSMKQAVPLHKS